MNPTTFVFALFALVLTASVAANDPTTLNDLKPAGENQQVYEKQQFGGGGGWGGYGSGGGWGGGGGGWGSGWGGRGGWDGWGGRGGWGGGYCRWGCCGGGYYGGGCRCCYTAQEALSYMQNEAKP